MAYEGDLNLKLKLGLPGCDEPQQNVRAGNKRSSPEISEASRTRSNNSCASGAENDDPDCAPPAKAQVVGWPPIRSYRKNCFQTKQSENELSGGIYVKVSVDGAPYLRKVDLKLYKSYPELLKAMEVMFKLTIGDYSEREGYNGSEYAPTYEDKDGDWMLVGDVPWSMFICNCKRLRIMRGSEARG